MKNITINDTTRKQWKDTTQETQKGKMTNSTQDENVRSRDKAVPLYDTPCEPF